MGNLKNLSYLQVFLGKLFEGIDGLVFENEFIRSFRSKQGEMVHFVNEINTAVPPEIWLKEVEEGMRIALYCAIDDIKTVEFNQLTEESLYQLVSSNPG